MGDLGVDGRLVKCISKEWGMRTEIGFS